MGDTSVREHAAVGAEVLSKLGHELRSPLAGIVGLSRILLMRINAGKTDPAQQVRQIEMIQASAERSLATVEHVVDIAKIESGRVTCERRPTDCRTVVTEVVHAFQERAESRGLRLRAEVPDHPAVIMTDGEILGRALRELVDNATKFSDTGEVVVRITAGDDQPTGIEVADQGPGIPADEAADIFDAYQRGTLAAERDDDGAGLGLYLARSLTDLLGATLDLTSRTGTGSTFAITFPAETVSAQAPGRT